MEKKYKSYLTVTHETQENKGYDYSVARRIFADYPTVLTVDFCNRGNSQTRYEAQPTNAVYVKSTSGRYGKAALQRVHSSDNRGK